MDAIEKYQPTGIFPKVVTIHRDFITGKEMADAMNRFHREKNEMQTSRRGFIQVMMSWWLLAISMGTAVWFKACSLTDVLADIKAWLPAGVSAVTNLINLLGTAGVIPVGTGTAAAALLSLITTTFQEVLAAITEYQTLPQTTTLQKIQSLLQAASDHVAAFVADLKISDNKIVQLVGALISLFATTISGFIASIAAKMGASVSAAAAQTRRSIAMQSGPSIVVEPHYRNRSTFVHDFNKAADNAGHPEIEIQ